MKRGGDFLERKLILASHGKFASGIKTSLEIIYGDVEKVTVLDCYTTPDFNMEETAQSLIDENENKEIIVVTDIFGGSVNNAFLKYINQPNFYLIAGMNLPLLIELIIKLDTVDDIVEAIRDSLNSSKESLQFCNFMEGQELEEEEF